MLNERSLDRFQSERIGKDYLNSNGRTHRKKTGDWYGWYSNRRSSLSLACDSIVRRFSGQRRSYKFRQRFHPAN